MTNTVGFHLYEVPRIDKFIEKESRMVVARGYQGGSGELVFNGYRVPVLGDENVLWMDGGDGCTTLGMYIMPLNCTPKNG